MHACMHLQHVRAYNIYAYLSVYVYMHLIIYVFNQVFGFSIYIHVSFICTCMMVATYLCFIVYTCVHIDTSRYIVCFHLYTSEKIMYMRSCATLVRSHQSNQHVN